MNRPSEQTQHNSARTLRKRESSGRHAQPPKTASCIKRPGHNVSRPVTTRAST